MGLDLSRLEYSGDELHWSYAGFNDLRRAILTRMGLDPGLLKNRYQAEAILREHPLLALITHDDNQGILTNRECRNIANGLDRLLTEWPPEDPYYESAQALAELARRTADLEGIIYFN